jgi:hypothetical protein
LYSDDIDINLIYNYYDNINEYFEGYIGKTEEVKRKFTFEIKAYF